MGDFDHGPAVVSSLIASGLLVIVACDLRERRLPNRVTYPLLAGALCSAWVWPDRALGEAVNGCAVAIGIVAALVFLGWGLTRRHHRGPAFGVGDMKLVVVLGAIVGWPLIAWSLLLGATLGGIGAAVALVARQRHHCLWPVPRSRRPSRSPVARVVSLDVGGQDSPIGQNKDPFQFCSNGSGAGFKGASLVPKSFQSRRSSGLHTANMVSTKGALRWRDAGPGDRGATRKPDQAFAVKAR